MTVLAMPIALAAFLASFIAALRLLTRNDEILGRSHITVTLPFIQYLLIHSLASLLPFLLFGIWRERLPLISVSPWLVAVVAPLVANQLLKLEGLDLPEATGPLSKFRDELRKEFEERIIEAEFVAMRKLIAPFAEGMDLFFVRVQIAHNLPLRLPAQKRDALHAALRNTKTVEDAMELYIRHIGRKAFLYVFGATQKEQKPQLAKLPLFDDEDDKAA